MRFRSLSLPLLLIVACGDDPATHPPPDPELFGIEDRPINTTCLVGVLGTDAGTIELEPAFQNLNFGQAILLIYPPDDSNRIVVVRQNGTVEILPNDPNATTTTTFLNVNTQSGGEQGLLGLAFHPDYASNGHFFVYYTAPGGMRRSVISRFTVSADPNVADPMSEQIILEVAQPDTNHNGGHLAFGPDGYLYIGLGDGGSFNDMFMNGQNNTTLLGSILRIDVDSGTPYGIPPGNPFVGTPGADEIWAWGLRNPWRFSFDRQDGTLYAGDVGQGQYEEIDVIEGGNNYGWPIFEGFNCFDGPCPDPAMTPPIAEYDHGDGCSVTGGFVYRGNLMPALQGMYLYADYCSGNIWGLRYENGMVTEGPNVLFNGGTNVSSFGEDEAGEMFVVGHGGLIQRVIEGTSSGALAMPALLSGTGCYDDLATQTTATGLIPFDINSWLWSDGTWKRRFLLLPGTSRIRFTQRDAWDLPFGATLMKEFWLERVTGDPSSRELIETRFLVRRSGDTWEGYTYEWSGNDATLLATAVDRDYAVDDGGTMRMHTHSFPAGQCLRCHTRAAGRTLGVRTPQINREFDYGTMVDSQLRVFDHIGLFTTPLPGTSDTLPRFARPTDRVTGTTDERARAYLAANCSHCHQPGGPTPAVIDLRPEATLFQMGCGSAPGFGDLGVMGAEIIKAGVSSESVLFLRATTRGADQMPPLATHLVDPTGEQLMMDWIDQMTSCL